MMPTTPNEREGFVPERIVLPLGPRDNPTGSVVMRACPACHGTGFQTRRTTSLGGTVAVACSHCFGLAMIPMPSDAEDTEPVKFTRERCGTCAACRRIEKLKGQMLAICRPAGKGHDDGTVQVWNDTLRDNPCETWKEKTDA